MLSDRESLSLLARLKSSEPVSLVNAKSAAVGAAEAASESSHEL